MRTRSKILGLITGAAGLTGGGIIAGAPAEAATPVVSCNGIHGTNPANSLLGGGMAFYDASTGLPTSLTNTPKAVKSKFKIDKLAKAPVSPGFSTSGGKCTPGAAPGAATVGDPKAFSGTFSGKISCNPFIAYPTQVAPVGSLTLTYTSGTDPVTGAAAKSTMAVTISQPAGLPNLDQVRIHGIVTKGVEPGADVTSYFLQQPVAASGQSPTGTSPWWDATEVSPGVPKGLTLTADNATLNLGVACITGAAGIPAVAFGTDGTSTGGGTLHSSLAINRDS